MKIGELAADSKISAQAVRFYERAGLLPQPQRTGSGYRVYAAADLKRLRFIRKAKQLGFSLEEIHQILRLHDAGHAPCAQVIAIAERHLREVEREIDRLERFREGLARSVRKWKRRPMRNVAGSAICELIEEAVPDVPTAGNGRRRA